jgi:uroporphyrinogen-III decarboxylase
LPAPPGPIASRIDNSVDAAWAAAHVQKDGCVQGNLDPRHMVTAAAGDDPALVAADRIFSTETRRIVEAFRGGSRNLGHITYLQPRPRQSRPMPIPTMSP